MLGGFRTPGLAIVKGAGCPRKWDIRDAYGFTGATIIYCGQQLAKFEIDIFAWEPEHFAEWELFAQGALAAPTLALSRTGLSLSIQHPAVNDPPLSITQVVVEDVSQWEQDQEGGGLWARTIKLIEYRKAKQTLVRPPQGPPGTGGPVVEAPIDPEQKIIAANSQTINGLAGTP